MSNSSYRIRNCNCLQGCSEVNYKFFIASSRKFTHSEVEELCYAPLAKIPPHHLYVRTEIEAIFDLMVMKNLSATVNDLATENCISYIKNEYAHVRVRIDGSSFLRHREGLAYSTSDKIAVIGGTLGLFSGFSVLVIFEAIHWLVITIKRIFYPKRISVEPEDPQAEKFKKLEQENQDLKNKMLKMEEFKDILMAKGILTFTADQQSASVEPEDTNTIEISNLKERNQVLENKMLQMEEMKKILVAKGILMNEEKPLTVINIEEN